MTTVLLGALQAQIKTSIYCHAFFMIQASAHSHPHTTVLRVHFVEELDLIVAACEDGNICETFVILFQIATKFEVGNFILQLIEKVIKLFTLINGQQSAQF